MQLADGELRGLLAEQYLRHIRICPHCIALAADLLFLDALIRDQVLQGLTDQSPFGVAATGRGLRVSDLPPGERLTADVYDRTGALLLMEGTLISPTIIDALQARGIDLVFVGTPPTPDELAAATLPAATPVAAAPAEEVLPDLPPVAVQENDGHPFLYLQDVDQAAGTHISATPAVTASDPVVADLPGHDIAFVFDQPGDDLVADIPVEIPEGFYFGTRGQPRKFHPNDYRDLLFVAQAEPSISQATKLRAYTQLERSLTELKEAGVTDLAPVRQTSAQIIGEILADPQKTCSLADLFLVSSQVFSHCFNTLVTFVSLGRALNLSADHLAAAGECALFHDIGRILPLEEGDTTAAAYRRHPQRGYEYLLEQGGFDTRFLEMVRDHHERVDGRGFARGLRGAQLSQATQLLIVANTYDTLCTDPVHGVKRSFHRAAQAIVQSGGQLVAPEITRAFLQVFGMYPPGTLVQLRSRELAVVREATFGRPFQPQVSLLRDAAGGVLPEPVFLDLATEQVPIERALDAEAVLAY